MSSLDGVSGSLSTSSSSLIPGVTGPGAVSASRKASRQDTTGASAGSADFASLLLQQFSAGAGAGTGSAAASATSAAQTQSGLLTLQEQSSDESASLASSKPHHTHHGHHHAGPGAADKQGPATTRATVSVAAPDGVEATGASGTAEAGSQLSAFLAQGSPASLS